MDEIAHELAVELDTIHHELRDLQARFGRVMARVKELPGGRLVWERVDAYPGVRLDREMGAGQDALGWIEEVSEFLIGREG